MCAAVMFLGFSLGSGADDTASYQGLELAATSVARSTRVSLQDCPPGENIVRGVIRPVEDNEFATVQLDVKVLPAFERGEVPKPLLYDDAGTAHKTAQSFRGVGSQESYGCKFSFRVPKGTKLTHIVIDDATLELGALEP